MKTTLAVLALALATPTRAVAAAPVLQPCVAGDTNALCGTVIVPESRGDPASTRTIALRVAVLPATHKPARLDPVFYVTGGPGGVDFDTIPAVAQGLAAVNEHRDVVFVDQRGVGLSNPLACALPGAGFTGTPGDYIAGCLRGTTADVRHYRTTDAADDLDDVRVALGYGQIDLLGGSYGATFVQVFLNRHPSSVRAAVIDGATLLDIPVFERWASSAQRALTLVHKRCVVERACARTFPHWYERLPALLRRLSHHPVAVQRVSGTVRVDAAATADTIEDMTTSAYEAALLPATLALAEAGNFDRLAGEIQARASTATDLPLMPLAIECTEPWARMTPANVWTDAKATYLRYSYPAEAVLQSKVCAAWPKVDTSGENWQRPHTTVPVLDLVGGADPKDPLPNVAGLQAAMPNSAVVVVPGQGHGVMFAGCMPRVIDAFLEAGTPRGLDTSCVPLIETPAFLLR